MAPPPTSTIPFPLGRNPPRTSSSSRATAAPSLDSLLGNANARRTTSSVPSTLVGKASGLVLGSGTSRAPPIAHPRIPSSTAVLARGDPAQPPSTRALIGTNDDAAPLVNTAVARAASTDPSPAALVRSGKKPKAPRTEKQLAALASGRGRVAPPAPPRRALAAVDLEPTPRPHVAPVEQLGIELGGPRRHEDERDWAQYKVALREGRTGDIVKIGPKLWAVAPWDPERRVHPVRRACSLSCACSRTSC
ncbi:hypothetical protein DMC30DRAFT_269329 [Rhodotorula diobovata]|uniref:Uncharacterized protein n=1 Tax=Rhodotorula diobovata TaxID=5288 RepID=A0A5C5FT88_9BASI|nr:hypothetical protein DMC30DRAFT_302663 [Rhodotorula diobovata]TNY20192.1 hypothetical protein DMC30DRAFT_269329 [Rhodotorula diobovata]